MNRLFSFFLTLFLAFPPGIVAASWSLRVGDKDGLPLLTKGGAPAVSSNYAFWTANWKWADQLTEFKVIGPFEYSTIGKNQTLNADISARITRPTASQLSWEFDLDSRSTKPDAIGGGLVFKFDLVSFGREMGDPELLPNGQGWSWGRPGKSRVEMRFDPPLASIHFERGRKSEIRALFHNGGVKAGQRRIKAVVNVTGDVQIGQTTVERLGPIDLAAWPVDIIDWRTSPVDISFLNETEKPAGKRGFLKAAGDQLVFEDGTPMRFWGTNLTAQALYGTSKDNTKQQARRLSELGFNLVRLHHHDSLWVNPNIFGDHQVSDTQHLDAAMLDKLDWWIKCLKDEGIYVWLDLHVQRGLRAGDWIDGFDEIRKGKPEADIKGFSYVNPGIQAAMQRFNKAYLNHRNSYTGLRYKDEPAVAAMLITNENDVTHHFGNALLPDKNAPWHNALYMKKVDAFAAAWGLPRDKTWRSWEHGPSKLFLNDLERRFSEDMIGHLRSLGVKIPIATTSTWGYNPVSSLPALTTGTIIDVHSYGGAEDIGKNPLYQANLVSWMAAAHVSGKPMSVTEWNAEKFPIADRHSLPIYVAASASLQGWDAMMQYAYAQIPLNTAGNPSNWHAYNDPALMATLPAAALLYRRGHVRDATTVYAFAPTSERLFGQAISPETSVALRTAADRGKVLIALPQTRELPWLKASDLPSGARVITDPGQALIDTKATETVSDSGELRRSWGDGVFTVNTSQTQAATGWIGGMRIGLGDVVVEATTPNATIAVQSLDGDAIRKSHNILISLGARSIPKKASVLPFHSEPVVGKLAISARPGLKLYRAGAAGRDGVPFDVRYERGRYLIDLDRMLGTYWLQLRK